MAYDFEGARAAGGTDEQIAKYLASKHNYDLDGAISSGGSYSQVLSYLSAKETASPAQPESAWEAGKRGLKESFQQVPQLAYGLEAGAGAVAENVFGEGGLSTKIKESGVKGYQEKSAEIASHAQANDEFDTAKQKAMDGDIGALGSWLAHGLGYVSGQTAQMVGTFGVGSLAGKALGKGAVEAFVVPMVEKEAARIAAADTAKTLAPEALQKLAVSNVASKIGQNIAMAGTAFGMEGGEIYGDLVSDASKEKKQLTGSDLGRAFLATVASGGLEYSEMLLGMKALKGKLPTGEKLAGIDGMGGRLARAGVQTAIAAPAEYAQEYGQTLLEEYGKGKDPLSAESLRQAGNAGALGGLGGGLHGTVGGLLTGARKDTTPPIDNTQPDPRILSATDAGAAIKAFSDIHNQDDAIDGTSIVDEHATPQRDFGTLSQGATGFGKVNELVDLVEQEKADLAQRRGGLISAQQQDNALRMDSGIESADNRVAGAKAEETRAARLKLLDDTYSNQDERTPGMTFLAQLGADYPHNPNPTAEEKQIIAKRESAYRAFGATEPTQPDEVAPAQAKPNAPRTPEAQIAQVDEFLANGYSPIAGGKMLANAKGKKLLLTVAQREYVKNKPPQEPTHGTETAQAVQAETQLPTQGVPADAVGQYDTPAVSNTIAPDSSLPTVNSDLATTPQVPLTPRLDPANPLSTSAPPLTEAQQPTHTTPAPAGVSVSAPKIARTSTGKLSFTGHTKQQIQDAVDSIHSIATAKATKKTKGKSPNEVKLALAQAEFKPKIHEADAKGQILVEARRGQNFLPFAKSHENALRAELATQDELNVRAERNAAKSEKQRKENAAAMTIDPERDSLLTAIYKLGFDPESEDASDIRGALGLSKGENPKLKIPGVKFPVWLFRKGGKVGMDGQAEILHTLGYLDEYDWRELDSKMGSENYSTAYNPELAKDLEPIDNELDAVREEEDDLHSDQWDAYDALITELQAKFNQTDEATGFDENDIIDKITAKAEDETIHEWYRRLIKNNGEAIRNELDKQRNEREAKRAVTREPGEGNQPSGQEDGVEADEEGVAQPTQDYGDLLSSYSAEELKERQARIDAAEKEKVKLEARLTKEEKDRLEHEDIKRRSVAAAKTFTLGGDAATNLSGQDSLFQKAKHYDINQLDLLLTQQPLRPGEDTAETRTDRTRLAASTLLRGSRGSLLGLSLSVDWIAGKGSSLLGKRVASPQDLATLGALLRDPRAETFRYFLVKEGKVVYHTAVSSRMLGSSSAFVGDPEAFMLDLKATMERLGADNYYLMHNHPARNVKASSADINITGKIANTLPGFLGHVILDHTEFGLIDVDIARDNRAYDAGAQPLNVIGVDPTRTTPIQHAKLDTVVGSPQELASMADAVRQPDNIVLVATDHQMRVTGIMQVSRESMKRGGLSSLKIMARLRKIAGAHEIFAILPDGMKFDELPHHITKNGWLLDVHIAVAGKGVSAVNENMMAYQRGGVKRKDKLGMAVDQPYANYQTDLFSRMEEAKNEETAIAERKGSPQMDMFAEIYREAKKPEAAKPAPEATAQPDAKPATTQEQQATAILDRANVTGKDRLDIMAAFLEGKKGYALEDLEAAYPAESKIADNPKEEVAFNSVSDNPERWKRNSEEWKRVEHKDFDKVGTIKGYDVYHKKSDVDEGYIRVVTHDGNVIGNTFYGRGDSGNLEGAVEVSPSYRRQGIATGMYNRIEKITGEKLHPSEKHTPYAEAFWKNRKAAKAEQPSDNAVVNIPLSKRGNIDAQLDKYKREQAALAKTKAKETAHQTRENKALALILLDEYQDAIIAKHGEKFGNKELADQLDQWAKWEPKKLIDFVEKFRAGQPASGEGAVIRNTHPGDAIPESEWLSVGLLEEETSKLLEPFATEIPVLIRDTARSAGIKQSDGGVATGAVYNGRIHLFRDGLSDRAAVVRTLWHELLHFGFRRFMTEEQYIAKMGELYMKDGWVRGKATEWMKSAEAKKLAETKKPGYVRARGVDEALAELAEIMQTEPTGYQNNTKMAQAKRTVSEWVAKLADFFGFKEAAQAWRGYAAQKDARDLIVSTFAKLREGAPPSMLNAKWHYSDPAFMVAWHGSPHDHDRFDSSKIGTGEGAQAYGHGLYFASNRGVAEHYKAALSNKRIIYNDVVIRPTDNIKELFPNASWEFHRVLQDAVEMGIRPGIANDLRQQYETMRFGATGKRLENARALLKQLKAMAPSIQTMEAEGKLYQVELTPAEDEYLLWDKPLSEQSEKVKAALSDATVKNRSGQDMLALDPTGEEIVNALGKGQGASEYLHSIGIRGIKYLDGSSRDQSGVKWADGADQSKYDRLTKGIAENYLRDRGDVKAAIRSLREVPAKAGKQYSDAADALESGDLVQDLNHNYVIFDDKDVSITAKFSQSAKKSEGMTAERVKLATMKLRAEWKGFQRINVVQSVSEIPNELYIRALRALKPIDIGTEGIYDPITRSVYLIADNISNPERAKWVAIHEVVGHGGVRMLGGLVGEALDHAAKNAYVTKLAHAIAKDRVETFSAKAHIDEALAELSAATITGKFDTLLKRYGVNVPKVMRPNLEGKIRRVIAAVRKFIARIFGKNESDVSDADIHGLLVRMKDAVEGKDLELGGMNDRTVAQSRSGSQPTERSTGIPKNAALIADFLNDQPLKRHPDYKAAKAGDIAAAVRLVSDLVKPESIAAAKEKFGDDVAYLPVMAQEASGKNQIPNALASHYAALAGGTKESGVYQTNRAYHTGADAMERMIARSEFGGEIIKGQKYVLVDDVSTMGGTLADLASYIQANGGVVSGTVLLTNASRSGSITPDAYVIRILEKRHGQSIKQLFGIEPSALTRDESRYLIGFRTTDELRTRAATASAERGRRILSKNLSEPADSQAPIDDSPLASRSAQQPIPGTAQPQAQPPRQSNIPLQGGQPGNRASWDSPEPSKLDNFIYSVQNKHVDLKRTIEAIKAKGTQIADKWDTYLNEELFHGRAAKRTQDFLNTELDPLLIDMAKANMSQDDLNDFLHARHAKEANALIAQRDPNMQDGGSGMTDQQADAYMAGLSPLQKVRFNAMARKVDAILAKTRELYVSYELVSRNQADEWAAMFQHYVPLMREDHDGGMGVGQGFSIKGKEVKHRTGSIAAVVDIFANIALQREKAITRGEKNRVAVSLAGLAKLNPNPDFWAFGKAPTERVMNEKTGLVEERVDPMFKSRDNVVIAKIKDKSGNIQERAVIFNEHNERAVRMAGAIKNLDATQLGELLGTSAKITRYFASINTQYNPVFGVTNLVRDTQGLLLNLSSTPIAGHKMEVLKHIPSALIGIYSDMRAERKGHAATSQWAQLWEELQDEGGMTGYRDLYRTSEERANAIKHNLNPYAWHDNMLGKIFTAGGALKVPMTIAQKKAGWLFDWLSDYNQAMEGATRLAAYKVAREQGMSKPQAASLAKNITVNFNRKGQIGQQAGALYAFFNASMQGTARIGETMFKMDGGNIKTLRLNSVGKTIVYGGITLGAMQALALAAAGFDDDEPKEFVREKNLIIPWKLASFGMIDSKQYTTIPMPLGFHVLPNIGRITTEWALSGFKDPGKRTVGMLGVIVNAFNPIGGSGFSMQTIAPTPLDPLAALAENKDGMGNTIYKEERTPLSPTPGFTRNKDTATYLSKMIAEGMNYVTGGDKYKRGMFSPTADQLDYLIGQVTGGVGREVSKAWQAGASTMSGEELPAYKVPLAGRFYGNAGDQSSQSGHFYENLKRINEIESGLKGRQHDRATAQDIQEFRNDNPEYRLIMRANYAEKIIQNLHKQKRDLIEKNAPRERIKAVEDRITVEMLRFNNAVKMAKEKRAA